MRTGLLCLSLSALLLSCAGVEIPNTRVCVVAGKLSAGGDCAYTGSATTEQMSFEEFVDFLEAREERPDPKDPAKRLPAKGAALCQSSEDWTRAKTALEQACKLL